MRHAGVSAHNFAANSAGAHLLSLNIIMVLGERLDFPPGRSRQLARSHVLAAITLFRLHPGLISTIELQYLVTEPWL